MLPDLVFKTILCSYDGEWNGIGTYEIEWKCIFEDNINGIEKEFQIGYGFECNRKLFINFYL